MVRDYLHTERPSRDERLTNAIRTAVADDWQPVLGLAHRLAPFDREGNEEWLRIRQDFNEEEQTRRHYVATHPDDGHVLGYGCIEQQDADPGRFRLYILAPDDQPVKDLGDVFFDRLMADLKDLEAHTVWVREGLSDWPPSAAEMDYINFLEQRGFVLDRLIGRWVMPLDQVDWLQLKTMQAEAAAQDISINTLATEMAQDPDALHKLATLFEAAQQQMATRRTTPIQTVSVEKLAEDVANSSIQPSGSALFVAKRGEVYSAFLGLRNIEEDLGHVCVGIPLVDPEADFAPIATALHGRCLAWARDHGLQSVYSFIDQRDDDIMAACQAIGYQRKLVMPILEMSLKD